MKKIILIGMCLLFITGCVQSSAMLGPTLTFGTSGNIYKSSLTAGTNYLIEEITGKNTGEHALSLLESPKFKKNKKIKKRLNDLVKNHIISTRKKLLENN